MSRYDLLPPNATPLERDLSRATSNLQRVGPPVPVIRTAKRTNIPDSVVPWLIFEYGLGEILPFIGNNQRRALAEGILWQRIRGTPGAIHLALSWIGVTGLVEESEGGSYRWSEYQLGLEAATTGEQIIDDIVGVARISSPVRSRLQRIYAVYDFRRFVLDDSLLSDGAMLSDHSGVRPRPDWPQISYGQIHSSLVVSDLSSGTSVSSSLSEAAGALVEMSDRFILSKSLIDEEWHTLNYSAGVTTISQEGVSVHYEGQVWGGFKWQPTEWPDVNVVASSMMTQDPPPSTGIQSLATFYYDFSDPDCYPGSGNAIYDLGPLGNDGTIYGNGVVFSTMAGGCLDFVDRTMPNGFPDETITMAVMAPFVDANLNLNPANGTVAYSQVAWVRIRGAVDVYGSYQTILNYLDDLLGLYALLWVGELTDGRFTFSSYNPTCGEEEFLASLEAVPGEWCHVAFCYSYPGTATIYVNSVQAFSVAITEEQGYTNGGLPLNGLPSINAFSIGAGVDGNPPTMVNETFNGYIGAVGVYHAKLTASQVSALYSQTSPRFLS